MTASTLSSLASDAVAAVASRGSRDSASIDALGFLTPEVLRQLAQQTMAGASLPRSGLLATGAAAQLEAPDAPVLVQCTAAPATESHVPSAASVSALPRASAVPVAPVLLEGQFPSFTHGGSQSSSRSPSPTCRPSRVAGRAVRSGDVVPRAAFSSASDTKQRRAVTPQRQVGKLGKQSNNGASAGDSKGSRNTTPARISAERAAEVSNRLYNSHAERLRRRSNLVEAAEREKQQQEEGQRRPTISSKSRELARNIAPLLDRMENIEHARSEELTLRQQERLEEQVRDCTFEPVITKKALLLQRNTDDQLRWNEQRRLRIHEAQAVKQQSEVQECTFQPQHSGADRNRKPTKDWGVAGCGGYERLHAEGKPRAEKRGSSLPSGLHKRQDGAEPVRCHDAAPKGCRPAVIQFEDFAFGSTARLHQDDELEYSAPEETSAASARSVLPSHSCLIVPEATTGSTSMSWEQFQSTVTKTKADGGAGMNLAAFQDRGSCLSRQGSTSFRPPARNSTSEEFWTRLSQRKAAQQESLSTHRGASASVDQRLTLSSSSSCLRPASRKSKSPRMHDVKERGGLASAAPSAATTAQHLVAYDQDVEQILMATVRRG